MNDCERITAVLHNFQRLSPSRTPAACCTACRALIAAGQTPIPIYWMEREWRLCHLHYNALALHMRQYGGNTRIVFRQKYDGRTFLAGRFFGWYEEGKTRVAIVRAGDNQFAIPADVLGSHAVAVFDLLAPQPLVAKPGNWMTPPHVEHDRFVTYFTPQA